MARHMDYYETVLEQGDVLYIPPYYWHHVLNPVSSIGVGFRWNNLRTALRASPLLTTMETFNTNPNVIRAMMMTLTDFNLVLAQNKAERKRKLAQQA
jgi:ribosomal protein L16 Arg81 hydroxylase